MSQEIATLFKTTPSFTGKFNGRRSVKEMRVSVEMDFLKAHVQKAADRAKKPLEQYVQTVDPVSLNLVLLEAAQTGFTLSPHEHLAYAIPRWNKERRVNEFDFCISYRGFIQRVLQSGVVRSINCELVYDNDLWERWNDETGPHFRWQEADGDRGKLARVFCHAQLSNGEWTLEVLNREQIAAHRNAAKTKMVWDGPFGSEMVRKACVRRARKYWPSSKVLDQLEADLQRLEPIEFDRPPEPDQVLLINQQQMDELVTFTMDAGVKEKRIATGWVERTAKAMGYKGGVMDLPVDQMDILKSLVKSRAEAMPAKVES